MTVSEAPNEGTEEQPKDEGPVIEITGLAGSGEEGAAGEAAVGEAAVVEAAVVEAVGADDLPGMRDEVLPKRGAASGRGVGGGDREELAASVPQGGGVPALLQQRVPRACGRVRGV